MAPEITEAAAYQAFGLEMPAAQTAETTGANAQEPAQPAAEPDHRGGACPHLGGNTIQRVKRKIVQVSQIIGCHMALRLCHVIKILLDQFNNTHVFSPSDEWNQI